MQVCHLAVDIGASSGRHIIGTVENGVMKLTEVYRFENGLVEKNGHLCWDLDSLTKSVIAGIREAHEQGYTPVTMGIDTWAVDFVLLDKEGHRIGDPVAYRDSRTDGVREKLEKSGQLLFAEHYARTGIQYQKFNTAYQLLALKEEHPEQLEAAEAFLMIPDYLCWVLTGKMANEYTNATTTALVGAESKDWDFDLIRRLGLPEKIFQKIEVPGTVLGNFRPEIAGQVGFDTKVVLPASHDTGSAYLAVPAKDENAIFLSSGTWSLMGVENKAPITDETSCTDNFTNEGGYEYRFRYLKNIMGLWMIQSVRREAGALSGTRPSFPQLIAAAKECADIKTVVNVDDPRFLAPKSMIEEIKAACAEQGSPLPDLIGAVMQVIYNSLSDDYRRTAETLSRLTGKTFTTVNIVGGGCQDMYLNQRTANAVGLPVYAGPVEGTALGNLMVQFLEEGIFKDLAEARAAIRRSFEIKEILPEA